MWAILVKDSFNSYFTYCYLSCFNFCLKPSIKTYYFYLLYYYHYYNYYYKLKDYNNYNAIRFVLYGPL